MIRRTEAAVVGARVDWLTVAFRLNYHPGVLQELRERGDVAKKHGAAAVLFGGAMWHMRVRQGGSVFALESVERGERVDVIPRGQGAELSVLGELEPGFTLVIHVSGVVLASRAPDEWIQRAWMLARAVGDVREARIRRLDLAVDLAGAPSLDSFSNADWLRAARRTQIAKEVDEVGEAEEGPSREVASLPLFIETRKRTTYSDALRTTGWVFGRGGDISVRVYDKSLELDATRAPLEQAIWATRGWQPGEQVTRVELQTRGTALDELCRHRLAVILVIPPPGRGSART